MPNYYQLTRKGEEQPSTLAAVDEAICAHLGLPVDPVLWAKNWENIEGLGFAMGYTMDKIREIDPSPEREPLRKFLEENYTVDAWAEVGRR